ncbi:MAG: LysR family transcriptional regulator [Actinobacteria bacterium]|nr:LysR family transcriptional regulator [Actinomycetota bacterium]
MTRRQGEPRLELRHLRSFVAVGEELHFSRAARRLHIEQPALSQQIRQLERELGTSLFDRTTRRVELTTPGRVLLERARRVLAAVERGVSDTRRAARGELGWLVIGFVDSAAYSLLPPILRELRRAVPDLSLELRELSTEAQLTGLLDDIDVGIVRDVDAFDGLQVTPVLTEPLVAAVPAAHALAARSTLALSELAAEPFVSFPREHVPHIHDRLVEICRAVGGFPMRTTHQALQYPTILGLVAADYGVALVPASLRTFQHAGMAFVELSDAGAESRLAVARRAGNDAPATTTFIDVTRAAVAAMAS